MYAHFCENLDHVSLENRNFCTENEREMTKMSITIICIAKFHANLSLLWIILLRRERHFLKLLSMVLVSE